MSRYPCQVSYRSSKCPPLSDSESESDASFDGNSSSEIKNTIEEFSMTTRTDSISLLKSNVDELQAQLEEIQLAKECVQSEIRVKREKLIEAVLEVVKSEKCLIDVDNSMADQLYDFQTKLFEMEHKRMEIFKALGDNKETEVLDVEIDEVRNKFQDRFEIANSNKEHQTQKAQVFAASLGDAIGEFQKYFVEMIAMENNAAKVETMTKEHNDNLEHFQNLVKRPLKYYFDSSGDFNINNGNTFGNDENGDFYIDLQGRKIYKRRFFCDRFGVYFVNICGNRTYKEDSEASEYILVQGNWTQIKPGTYERDERGLRIRPKKESDEEVVMRKEDFCDFDDKRKSSGITNDDINYIKTTVGPVLRKGLAAVVLHQPIDPINYFANFLLNYRNNLVMLDNCDIELNKRV
ncbi:CLUMA_CG000492, isoform A [Clunio marinus]|uniref:CLUMA_CG000492, isoform A n=1 Tax=Clunio marinus TaxID=568069 RepID=A0A1J1HF95_9DIPT|nr:CLUMA_CG000492, isoform A [Clunio marinus]